MIGLHFGSRCFALLQRLEVIYFITWSKKFFFGEFVPFISFLAGAVEL